MPSFTGKTFASFYKNILGIDQSNNTGVDATTRAVHDGTGQSTSISLSDDVLSVQPVNDDTTGAMIVKNSGGSNILTVNTTDSKVLVGASQVATNTHYQTFTANYLVPVAGYHQVLQAYPSLSYGTSATEEALGNVANPSTTYDMSSGSDSYSWVPLLWRVQDNITIDSASASLGTNGSSTDALNLHIMSYTIDTDNGVTSGDLSAGVVVADSASLAVDRTAVDLLSLTVQSADVDANKVLVATIESDGTDPVGVALTMKYHIR